MNVIERSPLKPQQQLSYLILIKQLLAVNGEAEHRSCTYVYLYVCTKLLFTSPLPTRHTIACFMFTLFSVHHALFHEAKLSGKRKTCPTRTVSRVTFIIILIGRFGCTLRGNVYVEIYHVVGGHVMYT